MAIQPNHSPRLEIKQSQSLLMTPQLRQAINLLQMSNLELNELVEKELETNPLLEREDERINDFEPEDQNIDNYDDEQSNTFETDDPAENDDFGSDREGYEQDYDYSPSKGDANEDFDYMEKRLSDAKSLYEVLAEQISLNFDTNKEKIIARHLCEYLDDAGYFRGDIKTIAAKLNTKEPIVANVLKILKTFEPSGIFAENLKECLAIQLYDIDRLDPLMEKLLDNLELLAQRDFRALKKLLDADDEDLLSMINDIKSLQPKPTIGFDHTGNEYVIPDVFVKTNKYGEFRVELNSQTLPKVLINQQYYSEIRNNSSKNKEAKRYLKEQMSNASFLVKALHQRATTILKVSEEIVKTQREFFEKGVDYLKPMQLKDIAEAVEMHESTISRVTSNKYMHSPRGLFELKYFFSAAASSYNGDESTSTLSIKHKIKKLIEEESKDNVLSDDKLVEEMAKQGFKIARRTITKYRESMSIPTSAERKRANKAQKL